MKKRKRHDSPELVTHPRYGASTISSGLSVPEDVIRQGFWRNQGDWLFPESVLIADPSKQNYSVFPRAYYVDVLRNCRKCERRFIFFAREQRYWFETLRFYVDADCVDCPVCRRDSQVTRRRLRRYSDLLQKAAPSDRELMSLVDDGAYLLTNGTLRRLDRIGQLKNEALKHIPDYKGIVELVKAITAARNADSAP